MYGQSSIPREAEFTTTQRRRIGHRIGHLYDRLLLWRAAACDLSPAEHLIAAAHPTCRGYGLSQVALDYWDSLPQTERDALLAKGDARLRRHESRTTARLSREPAFPPEIMALMFQERRWASVIPIARARRDAGDAGAD